MDTRQPIIVGVGQVTERSDDLARKREPVALAAEAARLAFADAQRTELSTRVDSVRVVNMLSGAAYDDPPGRLAQRLELPDGERLYTAIGGNGPQWLINSAADDIAAGRCRATLIAGGEALHTLRLAARQGVELAWARGRGGARTVGDDRQGSHQDEWSYGLQMPTQIYPLFEVALRAHERRAPAAHQARLAGLCASLAAVAATHPNAWFRDGKSADEIGTLTAVNRMVAYPYPKYMTSIIDVDQAAAVVITSVAEARALGVPESRWVYVHGCGEANDIWHLKDRVDYASSPGMAEAYRQALEQAAIDPGALTHVDLYSCFPVAVQMGARLLRFPTDGTRPLTVTGGLPYFGGAGNNYALHAVATMVERLRERPGALGLVSALGWYLTKHAVGIYGSAPPVRSWARPSPKARQPIIDALPRPEFVSEAIGRGSVETYTVLHDREGAPSEGIVIVRCEDGRRTLALLEPSPDVFAAFEAEEMVGAQGMLSARSDGRLELRLRGA
jgi:acetyl-CoA C-acetyltransferase